MEQHANNALALDFDGVIVDSQPMHYQAWLEVVKQLKLEVQITPASLVGSSVQSFLSSLPLPGELAQEAARLKRDIVTRQFIDFPPPLYPSVKVTLELLSQQYTLALVSSAEKPAALHALKHHRLYDLFTVLVLDGDCDKPKPHPAPYLACLAKLGLGANEVIAIEDSEIGIASAQTAGLRTIAISTTCDRAKLLKADFIIERFDQIIPLLENNIAVHKHAFQV